MKLKEIIIAVVLVALVAGQGVILLKLNTLSVTEKAFGGQTQLKNDFKISGSLTVTGTSTIESSVAFGGGVVLGRLPLDGDRVTMTSATSTPCVFENTSGATTTPLILTGQITVASGTADIFAEWGIGAISSNATTTSLGSMWWKAGLSDADGKVPGIIIASTTGNLGSPVLAPGQRAVLKVAAKGADLADTEAISLTGTCSIGTARL